MNCKIILFVIFVALFIILLCYRPKPLLQSTKVLIARVDETEDIQKVQEKIQSISLPPPVVNRINNATTIAEIKDIMTNYHNLNKGLFEVRESDKTGVGVFATRNIKAYTLIGRYPGYLVDNTESSTKLTPKYILVRFNPADEQNKIFKEFSGTITPFLNEPSANDSPNCCWFQEESPYIEEGRYSIITVKDIIKDEECTLSYGPYYRRDYPYSKEGYVINKTGTSPNSYQIQHYDETNNSTVVDTITESMITY